MTEQNPPVGHDDDPVSIAEDDDPADGLKPNMASRGVVDVVDW